MKTFLSNGQQGRRICEQPSTYKRPLVEVGTVEVGESAQNGGLKVTHKTGTIRIVVTLIRKPTGRRTAVGGGLVDQVWGVETREGTIHRAPTIQDRLLRTHEG
jgi:hypothetical protein